MRRLIIGITRFALAGNMGEGQSLFLHRKKPKEYKRNAEWTHSLPYTGHRLQLWQALALPSILQMWHECPIALNYHYVHLVATNREMPRYEELRATFPAWMQMADIEIDERLEVGLQRALARLLGPRCEYFTFRLDDDDALIGSYPRLVARLWDDDSHKGIITPACGYYIGLNRRKPGELPLRMVKAVNLGSPHGTGAYNQNVHSLGKHNAIPGLMPVERDAIYWLRTVHPTNVTLAGHAGSPWGSHAQNELDPEGLLARHFPALDPHVLRAAFLATPDVG